MKNAQEPTRCIMNHTRSDDQTVLLRPFIAFRYENVFCVENFSQNFSWKTLSVKNQKCTEKNEFSMEYLVKNLLNEKVWRTQ